MKELEILKLLADENRLKIFTLLLFSECCICTIEELLELKQANVSKHMMKFKKLNVVDYRKDAQWVYYRINNSFIEENQHLVTYIREKALQDSSYSHLIKQLAIHESCKIR